MSKILCVEDNFEFYTYLTNVLKEHVLTQASNLKEALHLVENGREYFDLILLDVSLPDGNGIKLISKLKESFPSKAVPILVLSSDSDVVTKVGAFGMGADDYIEKPPSAPELKARIEARLRGVELLKKNMSYLLIGDLTIDSEKMQVCRNLKDNGTVVIELTPLEFKILKILCTRPGQVFSRDHLIDKVWGISKFITQRTVDAHVSHIRQKLESSNVKIETILGVGYKVEVKETH